MLPIHEGMSANGPIASYMRPTRYIGLRPNSSESEERMRGAMANPPAYVVSPAVACNSVHPRSRIMLGYPMANDDAADAVSVRQSVPPT